MPNGQPTTLYWHDYETTGIDPKWDRPMQFAGLRTDEELNIIGEPLTLYCRLSDDVLPHPEACLVTGITPQLLQDKGVCEAEFIHQVHEELARPGTCGVGYNTLRFDDEFTRYTLYRNFYDPYAREWQNGNSRWDIIDLVRVCYALRPEGIEWPMNEDGTPSFKLENLSVANGIEHAAAHDAMSDVYATIGMARLIKQHQPRLYDYVYQNRDKRKLGLMLNVRQKEPVLHTSRMFPSRHGCTAAVVPIALHPTNKNAIIVYDLRYDPADLIELGAEQIHDRLFTSNDALPEGVERIALKEIHLNKCPVLSPMNTLSEQRAAELDIDLEQCMQHLAMIKEAEDSTMKLASKVQAVYRLNQYPAITDPDAMLYSGGFFNDHDKQLMQTIRESSPESLGDEQPPFHDPRLTEMLFRYRARNFPQTLSLEEQADWQEYRRLRLLGDGSNGILNKTALLDRVKQLLQETPLTDRDKHILQQLTDYADKII